MDLKPSSLPTEPTHSFGTQNWETEPSESNSSEAKMMQGNPRPSLPPQSNSWDNPSRPWSQPSPSKGVWANSNPSSSHSDSSSSPSANGALDSKLPSSQTEASSTSLSPSPAASSSSQQPSRSHETESSQPVSFQAQNQQQKQTPSDSVKPQTQAEPQKVSQEPLSEPKGGQKFEQTDKVEQTPVSGFQPIGPQDSKWVFPFRFFLFFFFLLVPCKKQPKLH